MNQKFSEHGEPWFQQPGCLMSHSSLVNNIPYHSSTAIYSQNQDPPPTSLQQFHHPPGETPPKAERVARRDSSSDLFSSLSLFTPSPLLSISVHALSHSFLSTLLPSRAATAAFGASDDNIKEAKNKKKESKGEKQTNGC
ncbi:hypothetical protein ILYODFUR_002796 [Ilyodon furcidens]|uniref:Uncharacterized protein n=1 Tax=Ilyodon furcidens TaxID=33524 RepID=A0ABV0U3Y9_9TELE